MFRDSPEDKPLPLVILFLFSTLALGQAVSSPRGTAEQKEPVIRVTTELIELRVVVTDKKGQPIPRLRKDDFTLKVGGETREIGFFSETRLPTALPSRRGPVRDLRGSLESPGPRITESPERTVMLFVDTLHLSISSLFRVKRSLRSFLDEQLGDHDLVAIVSTAKRLGVTGQFTRNRHVLRYAIDKLSQGLNLQDSFFTPYIAAGVERGDPQSLRLGMQILQMEDAIEADPEFLQALAWSRAAQVVFETTHRRKATLNTLEAAAEQMAGLPGQRLMVLYSDGFSLMGRFGTPDSVDLQGAISKAVRSGVVIYSIDGKGLQPPPLFSAAYAGSYDQSMLGYLSSSEKDMEDGMNALAKDTGGQTFFNTNDLSGALSEALDSNRLYYVLGFYPPEKERGKGFKKFTVRIKDHPEYRVRTQKGYSPTETVESEREDWDATPEKRFNKAVLAPLPVSNIEVFAWADFIETDVDDAQVSLHVHIDGEKVTMSEEDNAYRMELELMTYVFNKRGKSLDSKVHVIQGRLQLEAVEEIRQNGIYVSKRLTLKPGLYQLRVGVREKGTEQIGTSVAWIEVPKLPRKKVVLSSIMLADSSTGLDALLETLPGKESTGSHFREGLRFYRRGDAFTYLLVIYPAWKAGLESSLRIKAEFLLNGEPIAPAPYRPLATRLLGQNEKGTIVGGQIELSGTQPGVYELLVSVKDPDADRTVQRSAIFGID